MDAGRSVLAVVLAAACMPVVPAAPLTYVSSAPESAPARTPAPRYDELASDSDIDTVKKLNDATAAIVTSDDFKVYLSDIDAVLRAPNADALSGRRLAVLYLGLDQSYEQLPACYHVEAGGTSETARTGFSTTRSGCHPDGHTVADVTLRALTIARAKDPKIEARACAVNTLAHEWLHAIAFSESNGQRMVFEDGDHDRQRGAVATYVVGAVAQCVFLANAYGPEKFDVRRCVEAVGTNEFRGASCAERWGQGFQQ